MPKLADMESVKAAETAYADAGTALEGAYGDFEEARGAEAEAAEKLEGQYRALFAHGFVIERVIDADNVRYFAGMTEGNIFSPDDDGSPRRLSLDGFHAAALEGELAIAVRARLWAPGRDEKDLRAKKPQTTPQVTFEVPGIRDNIEVGDEVTRFSWMGANTEYSGPLKAIEWRLPTDEEVERSADALSNIGAKAVKTQASLEAA